MSNYDQTIKKLIEASPSWDKDGGGVRGRTVAPIIGGASVSGGLPEYVPQQFNQQNNQSFRRSVKPFSDLSLDGGGTSVAADSCIGLALYTKTVGTPSVTEVWISAGTVAGELPSEFNPAEGKIIASSGFGDVWAELNINGETGEVDSVAVTGGGTTPPDNEGGTSFYYTLGNYLYTEGVPTVTNYGCGSLDVNICRNWFVTTVPFFSVSFVR